MTAGNLQAGSMNKRVSVETITEGRDADGGITATWAADASRWASIRPLSGRELFEAQQVKSDVTHRFRIRAPYSGLNPTDYRIVYSSRTFNILSILDVLENGNELVLMCKEVT